MENKPAFKNVGNVLGIISLGIGIIMFFLVVSYFLKITPYKNLEIKPLVVIFFISPIGFSLGFISARMVYNKFAKWGIIISGIIFSLLFIYFCITLCRFLFGFMLVI